MNIRNADIHKAVDQIGVGGDAERYRWFVGCRTAPDVDNEPRVRDLDVPRPTSAQNATPEDRFVKSKRSFDVGDGEKVCDGKPVLRRHLIAFLLDLYLVHRRLQLRIGCFGRVRLHYRGRAEGDGLEARSRLKRPSGSVHSATGDHPPARSNIRASRAPYLRQFSVWIVSPFAIENALPATVNSISHTASRCISMRAS